MNALEISSAPFERGIVLTLSGSAGIASADRMELAVTRAIAAQPAVVIVDLSGLSDLSSLFMGQLIALHNGLRHHGGRAILTGARPTVLGALERIRVQNLIPIVADLPAAMAMASN